MLSLTDIRSRVIATEETTDAVADRSTEIDPTIPWYAAQTNPRLEVRAMHGLQALGWRTFVPFGWRWARPRHAPSDMHVLRRRPAMPGYLFFIAPTDARGDVRTSEARAVDGVKCLVSQSNNPLKVRPAAIELLRKAEASGAFDFNTEPPRGKLWDLKPGDRIRIMSGPCEGWLATVQRSATGTQVEVIDDVFGAKITVALDRVVPIDINES